MFDSNMTTDVSKSLTAVSPKTGNPQPLRDSVRQALQNYFSQLDGEEVTELYEMVLSEVEAPLLDVVMTYTRGNQTKAANMLGINRGTLRKKLKKYGMN
ncbi:DNA-binding transcriptional regulator Fis [Gallaecimonas xiamenensis]|uniref:Putative Fis-like DNA-binding protein n=1 Tax=Gallaecimonas xiamenensis 3-C-1 TaxID=745411 RepID=K2JP28_9GAMM|nr:DNA-binding transcriptional regulator Fis [Gallaecimonas xiamenensis]EKE77028.1 global DNA-binding transcriptional dual regulator Fis [Gallaecimonas xiamenensis 3-C-1]